MKNTFGHNLTLTLFGESHGPAIGCVLDGLTPGIPVDTERIAARLAFRRPADAIGTARAERDAFTVESGVYRGFTTGTPLCIVIPNEDAHSRDYDKLTGIARPAHCDYPAHEKYRGFEDSRGGGHFSGRVTAAIVAAAAIVSDALEKKGIRIATHLQSCAGIHDRDFDGSSLTKEMSKLNSAAFPVLDASAGDAMRAAILAARDAGDSVGGVLETLVTGLPAGLGEPWFDTVEGILAQALFSVPAVKGVEFGDGFALAGARGSQVNDPYRLQDGRIVTSSNHMGGIGGGITNGMPVMFRCAVKPTPSVSLPQKTVNFTSGEEVCLTVAGRHDPCIAPRARAVIDAVTALTLADLYVTHFGIDALRNEECL